MTAARPRLMVLLMEDLLNAYVVLTKMSVLAVALTIGGCLGDNEVPTHADVVADLSWRDVGCQGPGAHLTFAVELAPPSIEGVKQATCVVDHGRVDCLKNNGSPTKDFEVVVDFPGSGLTVRTGECTSEYLIWEVTWR